MITILLIKEISSNYTSSKPLLFNLSGIWIPLLRVIQLRFVVLAGKYKYLWMELIQTFLQIESVVTNAFKIIPIGMDLSSLVDFV